MPRRGYKNFSNLAYAINGIIRTAQAQSYTLSIDVQLAQPLYDWSSLVPRPILSFATLHTEKSRNMQHWKAGNRPGDEAIIEESIDIGKCGKAELMEVAYPKDWFLAGEASLWEVGLVARLTEDLLILKDKGGVLQGPLARAALKVLRMPHPPHRTRKWTSANWILTVTDTKFKAKFMLSIQIWMEGSVVL